MPTIVDIMPSKSPILLPKTQRRLKILGENIRIARLRRNFTAEIVAQRAGLSRATLSKIEKGDPSVTIGSYCSVLHSLGLDKDIEVIAAHDELGRHLQDTDTLSRQRASTPKLR